MERRGDLEKVYPGFDVGASGLSTNVRAKMGRTCGEEEKVVEKRGWEYNPLLIPMSAIDVDVSNRRLTRPSGHVYSTIEIDR